MQQQTEADRTALTAECWYLTGATASGKTAIGIQLAQRLDAEIISMDSMALYRRMDIATPEPSCQQRREVPHHLVDLVDPDREFSVSNYVDAACRTVREIRSRGKEVLFVGGTPLYLKALLRGIFNGPPADWEFRRAIEDELQQTGVEALHERLRQVDPLSAQKLHPHDKRRIIRALEVYRLTGRPISHLQTQFEESGSPEHRKVFVLSWPREQLHERINRRVEAMFAEGFVDEVHRLLERFGQLSRTASQAVGYREVIDHVRIDVSRAHFWDITAISALDKVVMKFRREGTTTEVIGLNEASATMIDRFAVHDKPGSERDLLLEQ